MKLTTQRRISADLLKCGESRIWFDPNRLSEIKEAITKYDIRSLIKDLAIQKKQKESISSFRFRRRLTQKRKGRLSGQGSRKGGKSVRTKARRTWIKKIRLQRKFLRLLRNKKIITPPIYKSLYMKSKGGFFRSKAHIKLYLEEHGLGKHEIKTNITAKEKKTG